MTKKTICFLGWVALTACNASGDEAPKRIDFGTTSDALTSEQARVLGFETPTADWTSTVGTLGSSANTTEGDSALAVTPDGWTEINSIPLSTLANAVDTLSYDIYLPEVPGWGETRAILVSPTLEMWWSELGRQELTELPGGQYSTVSLPLSPEQVASLSTSYSDLTLKLVINAPALGQPYLIDNIVVTDDTQPNPPPTENVETFTVLVPSGVSSEQTFLSATDHLSVFSQAHAGVSGEVPAIANFGIFTTYLQAEAHAYADIYSVGPVQLDVKTRIGGSITSEGVIGKQGLGTADAPIVDGTESPSTAVPSDAISWSVAWPTVIGSDINLAAAPTQAPVITTLVPGAYGDFNVHSRNHVFLSSGTYFFDTFNTEPEAELHLDSSAGAVVVYVKDNLPWGTGIGSKAPIFTDSGDDAQLLLGFLGSGEVFIQGSFQGTVVASEALIKLERPSNPGLPEPAPSHQGAFFGKSVEIAAGQHTVLHTPIKGGLPIVKPLVTCIDSVGAGQLSAKFGYENPSVTALTIPIGANNALAPAPLQVLGQTTLFEPGGTDGAFRATFPVGGSLTWTINGQSATADATTAFCPLPQPPELDPADPVGDGPRGFSSKVGPLEPYFVGAPYSFFSLNFDDPDGNVPNLSALVAPPVPVPVPVPAGDTVTLTLTPTAAGFSSGITMLMGLWFTFSDVSATEFELTATGPNVGATEEYGQAELFRQNGNLTQTWLDWQWTRTASLADLQQHQIDVVYFDGGGAGHAGEIPSNGGFGIDAETLFVLPDETGVMAIDCENGGTLQLNPPLGCAQTGTDCCRIRELHGDMYADFRFDITCDIATTLPCSTGPGPGVRVCNPDGVSQCVATGGPPPPAVNDGRVCVEWTTDFVDEGFGEAEAGPHPASFAEYFLFMDSPAASAPLILGVNRDPVTGAILQSGPTGVSAFLDEDGCIPNSVLDPDRLVHKPGDPADDMVFELRVRSAFESTTSPPHTFTVVRAPGATPAPLLNDAAIDAMGRICLRMSNEPGGALSTATWTVDTEGWAQPPDTVILQNPTLDSTTNAGAMVSRVMKATGDAIRPAAYRVVVGSGCVFPTQPLDAPLSCMSDSDCTDIEAVCDTGADTCACASDADCRRERDCVAIDPATGFGRCGVANLDSCAIGTTLSIGPAFLALNSEDCQAGGTACSVPGQLCLTSRGDPCPSGSTCQCRWVDQSRWKFSVTHEAGHVVQNVAVGTGTVPPNYTWQCDVAGGCPGSVDPRNGELFDPPSTSAACACEHVDAANRLHCIQSIERLSDAQGEGFAHFFSSLVWNDPSTVDQCTFTYYKEMLLDDCPDPDVECQERPEGGQKAIPPVPVSCSAAQRWRNTRCGGLPDTNNTTLAEMGTEQDWMQFLYNWNARGPDNATLQEQFSAYRQICNPTSCINPTTGERFSSCNIAACTPVPTVRGNQAVRFVWVLPGPPVFLPTGPSPPTPSQIDAFQRVLAEFERSRSFQQGVQAFYSAELIAGDLAADLRLSHFNQMALDHGVGDETSP